MIYTLDEHQNGSKVFTFFMTWGKKCNKIFLSKYFFLFLFCLACAVSLTKQEIVGAVIFVGLICVSLILCEDILATTLPFLLLCVFVTRCYNSYDSFIKYAWIAAPAVISLLFHFIIYRKPIKLGATFWGLSAVTVSLFLGGVGRISATDYFRPSTLYYTVFLGVGMVVAYILLKSQLSAPRSYDVREKFILLLYIMGMFACFLVLLFTYETKDFILEHKTLKSFQASNNISTLLMLAMPCPFYFIQRNRLHLISALMIPTCIFLTGSRGGLIFGALEFVICVVVFAICDKPRRFIYVCILTCIVAIFAISGDSITQFTVNKAFNNFISANEPRRLLLERAWSGFISNPIFGEGLGYTGNTDLYNPVKGALTWYHMLIPQIVASLGIVGVAAYGFQFFLRSKTVILSLKRNKYRDKYIVCSLALSYIGLLLMSLVNPGIFCPLPYSLITVIIFAMIDGNSCSLKSK